MSSSRAIYLGDAGDLSIREINETYTPTGDQSLVSVKYSAINPADLRHFYVGIHSSVAGYEYIGPVLATGPESPFKKGDIVFGVAKVGHKKPLAFGAHQDFMLVEPFMTDKLPAPLAAREAEWPQFVGWPASVRSARDKEEGKVNHGWVVDGTDPRGKTILIWGASSSVGLTTLHFARIAGFSPIFVTASSHNHSTLLELGATACFDHRSPSVVADIRAAVTASGKPLSNIFDAVTIGTGFAAPDSGVPLDFSKSSPAIAKQCLTPGIPKEDIQVCASLGVEFDPDWSFCLSFRTKQDAPLYHDRMAAVLEWFFEHMDESGFRFPKVKIVNGAEEGIEMIKKVFEGKVSMEKVVIQHPI
ncbi:putative alcohol dehydrogenase [Seiridium cupressi]